MPYNTSELMTEVSSVKQQIDTIDDKNKNNKIERELLLKELKKVYGLSDIKEVESRINQLEILMEDTGEEVVKELNDIKLKMQNKGLL